MFAELILLRGGDGDSGHQIDTTCCDFEVFGTPNASVSSFIHAIVMVVNCITHAHAAEAVDIGGMTPNFFVRHEYVPGLQNIKTCIYKIFLCAVLYVWICTSQFHILKFRPVKG